MDEQSHVPLEVEHKFLIPDDIESRLRLLNATKVKEVSFKDVYLDTEDNVLALSGDAFPIHYVT